MNTRDMGITFTVLFLTIIIEAMLSIGFGAAALGLSCYLVWQGIQYTWQLDME